jgi:hypothetical protein
MPLMTSPLSRNADPGRSDFESTRLTSTCPTRSAETILEFMVECPPKVDELMWFFRLTRLTGKLDLQLHGQFSYNSPLFRNLGGLPNALPRLRTG